MIIAKTFVYFSTQCNFVFFLEGRFMVLRELKSKTSVHYSVFFIARRRSEEQYQPRLIWLLASPFP